MDTTGVVAIISGAVASVVLLLTNWRSDHRAERASKIAEGVEEEKRRAALADADEQKRLELRQARDRSDAEARQVLDAANAAALLIRADAEQRREKALAEADAYSTELRRAKDEEIADLKLQLASLRKPRREEL